MRGWFVLLCALALAALAGLTSEYVRERQPRRLVLAAASFVAFGFVVLLAAPALFSEITVPATSGDYALDCGSPFGQEPTSTVDPSASVRSDSAACAAAEDHRMRQLTVLAMIGVAVGSGLVIARLATTQRPPRTPRRRTPRQKPEMSVDIAGSGGQTGLLP